MTSVGSALQMLCRCTTATRTHSCTPGGSNPTTREASHGNAHAMDVGRKFLTATGTTRTNLCEVFTVEVLLRQYFKPEPDTSLWS